MSPKLKDTDPTKRQPDVKFESNQDASSDDDPNNSLVTINVGVLGAITTPRESGDGSLYIKSPK